MAKLSDTVVLERVKPDDVVACLVEAVNYAWHTGGNDGRCSVPANFVAWILQENERLNAALTKMAGEVESQAPYMHAIAYRARSARSALTEG